MLGVLGTALIILLVYAGAQKWPLWLLLPSVVLQIIIATYYPVNRAAMLSERGIIGRYIVMNIFIHGAVAFAFYGLGFGIALLF